MSGRRKKSYKPNKTKENNSVVANQVPPPKQALYPQNFLQSNTSWAGLFKTDTQKTAECQKNIMLEDLVRERELKQQELDELDRLEALARRKNSSPDPYQAIMDNLEIMEKDQQDRKEARKIVKDMTYDLKELNIRTTRLEALLLLRFNAQSVVTELSNEQYQLK